MKRLILLASASAIALGLGGMGMANAQGYTGYSGGAYQGGGYSFMTPDQVTRAQQELARAGFYNGPLDGNLGPATREALSDWQSRHGLQATGSLNQSTMASLGLNTEPSRDYQLGSRTAEYGSSAPYLQPGYQGAGYPGYNGGAYQGGSYAFVTPNQVAQAQQELARAGFYRGAIDGNLDQATSEALSYWQARHGLSTTGGLNPQTMASLGLSTAPPYTYQPNAAETGVYGSSTAYGYEGPRYRGAGYSGYSRNAYRGGGVMPEEIARAQQELARAGDYHGPIDGHLGQATREALGDWQSRHGIPATGDLNPQTIASLGLNTASPNRYRAEYRGQAFQGYRGQTYGGNSYPEAGR